MIAHICMSYEHSLISYYCHIYNQISHYSLSSGTEKVRYVIDNPLQTVLYGSVSTMNVWLPLSGWVSTTLYGLVPVHRMEGL